MPCFRLFPAFALSATLCALPALAQDKSASSTIQLPTAGGTVTTEEGAFTLNSNTGASNFRLPLPELPQRGGLGPEIALSYNQFAGDAGGGLGIGWGFTVPSVTVNGDLGTAVPGTRPGGDFFAHIDYMGARLMFQEESGGVWIYRPEFSETHMVARYHPGPFEVVTLDAEGTPVSETLPSGFVITEDTGHRRVFSGDPAVAEGVFGGPDAQTTRWPMVLEINPDNDAIRYDYQTSGGRSYLTEISFAGGQSVYRFDLIDTRGTLVSHASGTRQQNDKLYGRMQALFRDDVFAQWCFGYIGRDLVDPAGFAVRAHPDCQDQAARDLGGEIDPNSVNVLDQLRILYRFGTTDGAPLEDATLRLPEIRFDYSSWTEADLAGRPIVFEAPEMARTADIQPRRLELADLNMDALVDVVRTDDDGATVLLGEGSFDSAFSESTRLVLTRPTEAGMIRQVAPRLSDDRFHFADIFGDSFADVVEVENGRLHIYNGQSDGSLVHIGRTIEVPGISPELFTNGNGRFADLNMDGQSDIIATRLSPDGRTEFRIFLNLTRRTEDGGHAVSFGVLDKPYPDPGQDGQALSRLNVRLTDVNGDRLPDLIVIRPENRGFCLYANQGNIFSHAPDATLFGDPEGADPICGIGQFAAIGGLDQADRIETMWYIDVNGDGILDFASMGSSTDRLRVWLGFGDGSFLPDPLEIALNLRVQVGSAEAFRSRVADLDADGQAEIIVFQESSGDSVKPMVILDFNRTADASLIKSNLLTVVDFSSGRRHDIRYATSIDEMLRDRANGEPTRPLHFPVVVAKQMVTSEGVPGQERELVQTDEYFYHDPFYDILNDRFIGFARVERVTYGDEHLGDAMTQKTAVIREKFHTFAEAAADLHLAGKLRIRQTFEALPAPMLVASAAETSALAPGAAELHSLSAATRRQTLPETGRLLRCESEAWEAVPIGGGANYLRRTEARLTENAGPSHQQGGSAEICAEPVKRVVYADFDAFNLYNSETVSVADQPGPDGTRAGGFSRTTQYDYEPARSTLAALNIQTAVSERRVLSGTRVLSRERFTYLPQAGGRMGNRTLDVFSSISNLPDTLEDLHRPVHTLERDMGYDVFGNIVLMSDPMGPIEAARHDATGTLLLEHTHFAGEDDLNQVRRMFYDDAPGGLMAGETTPLGMTVRYDYDALGRRIAERAEDGAEKLYFYRIGHAGRPSMILTSMRRYPSGAETPADETEFVDALAAYNDRGRQIAKLEDRAGGGVRVLNYARYNRNMNLTFNYTPFEAGTDPSQPLSLRGVFDLGSVPEPDRTNGTAYLYDAAGRVILQADPSGLVAETAYAPWGTTRTSTYEDQHDGLRRRVEHTVFNENGVSAVIASDGAGTSHITRFTRDTFGYLREILLPGETTPRRVLFNSIGDLEYQAIPGMGEYYSFYDARGRQSASARVAADGEQQVLSYTYDRLNRKRTESENGALRYEFDYDRAFDLASALPDAIPLPLDQVTRVVSHDPNGLFDSTQVLAYDRNGRNIAREVSLNGRQFTETFDYTLDGRINAATAPGGLTGRFALGPDKNLRSVTISHPQFAGPETVIENVTYSPEGKLAQIEYRNGAFTRLTYDPQTLYLTHIASSAGGAPLQDLDMTFNQVGSITEIVDNLTGAQAPDGHVDRSGTFRYDFKNQLVEYARYGEVARFAYAPAGPFLRNDDLDPGAPLEADPAQETGLIPAGSAGLEYAFDSFGQIARSPRLTGTVFDAYGRLLRAQTATHDVSFGYDQTGRRFYKRVVTLDGSEPDALSLYPLDSFESGPDGDESFIKVGMSQLVRLEHETGRWFYYLKDHLESSDYLIASDGTPVEQMLYRAYGTEHAPEVLNPDWAGHLTDVAAALPQTPTRHRFTGKYLDDDTGLYYFGARYYDPALGRFVTPDPLYLSDPQRCTDNQLSCALFVYAANNPMAYVDPTGLETVIAPDAAYREDMEQNYQRFDPTARVDRETGVLSQSWLHGAWLDIQHFFDPSVNNFAKGRELVRQAIDNPELTVVVNTPGLTRTVPLDPARDITADPGTTIIHFDPTAPRSSAEFDPVGNTSVVRPADMGVVLAHETIHSLRLMSGTDLGDVVVTLPGLDGTMHSHIRAEWRTVGVGGLNLPGDITENDIRRMMGIPERNHAD